MKRKNLCQSNLRITFILILASATFGCKKKKSFEDISNLLHSSLQKYALTTIKRQDFIDHLITQLQTDFPIFRKQEQLSLHLITESKHLISQSQEMKKLMGLLSNEMDLTIKQMESDIKQFQEIIDFYHSFPTPQKEHRQTIVKQLLLIKQRGIERERKILLTYISLK